MAAMPARRLVTTAIGALICAAGSVANTGAQSMIEEPWSHAGLAGTYAAPAAAAPAGAAVLILPGSGPTDRDGNAANVGLATDTYRMLAAGLSESGIRSLRYDKRGIGGSRDLMAREQDLRFADYVD